jgi:hypothetical protein
MMPRPRRPAAQSASERQEDRQFTNALRAKVIPWLPDIFVKNIETTHGSDQGYMLIAVSASPVAPHRLPVARWRQYR